MGDIQMIDDQVFILDPARAQIANSARIDRWVKIEGTVSLGEHVHIASFSHIGAGGGEVVFGDNSGCSSHAVICSGQPDLSFLHISAADLPENQHPLRMRTVIGEHAFIGPHATIMPGVSIGEGAIVLAGAVVTRDIDPFDVAGGVPARALGERVNTTDGKFRIRWLDRMLSENDLVRAFGAA